METKNHPPEFSNPPPELALRPELEYTALPPEYGQRTAPAQETSGKKRRLRQLAALPVILLIGFLCFHRVLPPQPTVPTEPETTEPVQTEVESTAEPVSTELATEAPELPAGSVVLDVQYAVRDGNTVLYQYSVYTPYPSTQEEKDAYEGDVWPVSVYAQVRDEHNHAVNPQTDPEVWEDYPETNEERSIDATGLEGELTLTLRAVYTEHDVERQTVVELPLAQIPPAPSCSAVLEAFPGGDIDFTATLLPQPGDDHEYALQTWYMGQLCYYEGEKMGFSLGDNPRELPVTGDSEHGYSVHYAGGSAAASLPEGAELAVYVGLKDLSTGYLYMIESNRIDTAVAKPAAPAYPLGDGKLVITVYNDTLTFDYPSAVDSDDYRTLLAMEEIPEASFTSYPLPSALTPDGYDFAGWVIHVNNPMDLSSETDLFGEYNGDPPIETLLGEDNFAFPVQGSLTRDDVERVPPGEDGVRYINVHAVWIDQHPSEQRLFLDDGAGNETAYGMETPIASEGYLYLCNYPVPTREGLVFDGWYDEDGNRVDLLVGFFSFYPTAYDEDGNFIGYDWTTNKDVRLVAHWKPA